MENEKNDIGKGWGAIVDKKDGNNNLFGCKLSVRIVQGRFNALMDLVQKDHGTYVFKSGCNNLKYGYWLGQPGTKATLIQFRNEYNFDQ
jgi:hypothetical protein